MKRRSLTIVVALATASGCADRAPMPLPPSEPSGISIAPQASRLPAGPLDPDGLVALAEENNPSLRRLAAELEAAEGRLAQARLWPNPEVGLRQEDIPATASADGSGRTVASLDQPLIIGGRRRAAMAAARAEADAARLRYEAARLTLRRDLLAARARILFLRQSAALQMRLLRLAERVEAQASAPLDRSRARIESAANELEVTRATAEQVYAAQRLAVLVGADVAVDRLTGEQIESLDPAAIAFDHAAALAAHPEVMAADAATEAARQRLRQARAEVTPDLTVGAEAGYNDSSDEASGGVGLRIPLPIFDRSQGRIREAQAMIEAAAADRDDAARRLRTDLENVLQRLNEYDTLAALYRTEIVPASELAMEEAEKRFAAGEVPFLEVLDALRVHHRSAATYLEYLYELNVAWADLERIAPDRERGG